jgi:hypothetical protein
MKVTREEVQSLLNRLMGAGQSRCGELYAELCETLARAARALPSRQAVERDREKRKGGAA